MKIPAIRQLIQNETLDSLREAEAALLEEEEPAIAIEGEDEGEKLTHVLAAIWVKEEMERTGCDASTAIRNYSQKVRRSIS